LRRLPRRGKVGGFSKSAERNALAAAIAHAIPQRPRWGPRGRSQLCVDERPKIQALDRTAPMLPMQSGRAAG
jgi:hypothetical protein